MNYPRITLQVKKARARRHEAATKIRATWLGYVTRKRYLELLEQRRNPKKKRRKTRDSVKKAKQARNGPENETTETNDVVMENDDPSAEVIARFSFYKKVVYKKVYIKWLKINKILMYNIHILRNFFV